MLNFNWTDCAEEEIPANQTEIVWAACHLNNWKFPLHFQYFDMFAFDGKLLVKIQCVHHKKRF